MKLQHIIKEYFKLARLHQPIGIGLIYTPALAGLFLAHNYNTPSLFEFIYFLVGSILVRSLGCVINDLTDIKFDKQVARTKSRPLASGIIKPKGAIIFIFLLTLSALSLLFFAPPIVWKLSVVAMLITLTYPWMKRITYWPQIFLGFCMNFSMLIAFAFVQKTITIDVILLYLPFVVWTVFYDTIYAFQDYADDKQAGVKSTTLVIHNNPKLFLHTLATLISLGFLLFIIINKPPLGPVQLSCLIPSLFSLFWYTKTLDIKNKEHCLKVFKRQFFVGLLFALFLLDLDLKDFF